MAMDMASAPAMEAAAPADVQAGKVAAPGAAGVPVAGAMLAYTYNAGLTLPFEHVRQAMAGHEKACLDAGPAVCQVIGSSVAQPREDELVGALQLRAKPDFAVSLTATLEGDAAKLKGRIEQSRQSEDLTRAIIDTEASLRAKTTLRDRLQALLRDRPGRLSDLLETEQALANVQQEIDSAQSYLSEMRQRVSTSLINLNYATLSTLARTGAFEPLRAAGADFLSNVAASFAAIITLISYLLPWLVIGVPMLWLIWAGVRRWLPRLRKSATSGAATSPAKDT
jgi:hypothetical protein